MESCLPWPGILKLSTQMETDTFKVIKALPGNSTSTPRIPNDILSEGKALVKSGIGSVERESAWGQGYKNLLVTVLYISHIRLALC